MVEISAKIAIVAVIIIAFLGFMCFNQHRELTILRYKLDEAGVDRKKKSKRNNKPSVPINTKDDIKPIDFE